MYLVSFVTVYTNKLIDASKQLSKVKICFLFLPFHRRSVNIAPDLILQST